MLTDVACWSTGWKSDSGGADGRAQPNTAVEEWLTVCDTSITSYVHIHILCKVPSFNGRHIAVHSQHTSEPYVHISAHCANAFTKHTPLFHFSVVPVLFNLNWQQQEWM